MRILVLGGYGLIGSAVVHRLQDAGHDIIAFGRSVENARLTNPAANWVAGDIAALSTPDDWVPILRSAAADAIVNCAGALQDGARDKVAALQSVAMRALYKAAASCAVSTFVQISATRADPTRDTAFMRTKGEADNALQSSPLEWTILRPGLVISSQAYGGTALLRAIAATPVFLPIAFGAQPIQSVDVYDVAAAVVSVIERRVPSRRVYDLVEDTPISLADVLRTFRVWQGVPAGVELAVPAAFVHVASIFADMLGWFGWRSPLRSTAIAEIAAGIEGDAAAWRTVTGASLSTFVDTLRRRPAPCRTAGSRGFFSCGPSSLPCWRCSGGRRV